MIDKLKQQKHAAIEACASLPAALAYLSSELQTQDNLGTADPLFIVEERERIYGVGGDYQEGQELVGDEESDGEGEMVGYVDRWRFVTAAFTRKACQEYIEANRHNLTDPRVYVATAYRNREWIALRAYLMQRAAVGNKEATDA
jgi:hypothetical protein